MPCCATANPGPRVRPERRSDGSQTGRGERRLKAVSRRRRGRDSARLELAIDVADTSATTSTLDLQDSRSLPLLAIGGVLSGSRLLDGLKKYACRIAAPGQYVRPRMRRYSPDLWVVYGIVRYCAPQGLVLA